MTYIAKAMSKQTRLDAAGERAAREADGAGEVSPGRAAKGGEPAIEFISARSEGPEESRVLAPGQAAKTLAGMSARKRPEPPELPPEMLGTLESPPPEAGPDTAGGSRTWWKEPIVVGGGALGFAALLIGFLFAPAGDPPPVDSNSGVPSAGVVQASGASAASAAADREAGGVEVFEEGESVAANASGNASGRKPVVVRVQIDSGDGSSVEFESGESRVASAPRSAPKMPEIYEPLQPLELPPPPVADYTEDYTVGDPSPSSSGSSYSPPPSGDSITDYQLEGIFWSEDNPGVIINDEIVDEGERINKLKVLKIHKDYVVVQLHGRTYDLR